MPEACLPQRACYEQGKDSQLMRRAHGLPSTYSFIPLFLYSFIPLFPLFPLNYSLERGTLLNQPESQQTNLPPKSIFKKPSFYSKLVFAIAALIIFWIFFSRWWQNRSIEYRERQAAAEKQRADDRATLEQMGGKQLAIQTFYASPGEIRRGQPVQLCYGVANAKTVKLEPQSNPVWPSYSRCVNDSPSKTTTYTLTIADAAGKTKSQSLIVQVR